MNKSRKKTVQHSKTTKFILTILRIGGIHCNIWLILLVWSVKKILILLHCFLIENPRKGKNTTRKGVLEPLTLRRLVGACPSHASSVLGELFRHQLPSLYFHRNLLELTMPYFPQLPKLRFPLGSSLFSQLLQPAGQWALLNFPPSLVTICSFFPAFASAVVHPPPRFHSWIVAIAATA